VTVNAWSSRVPSHNGQVDTGTGPSDGGALASFALGEALTRRPGATVG
jgi:hypothetical protein